MVSRRRALALLLLLPLGGCGFHPLYADRPAFGYDPTLATISVLPIPNRIGQIIETALREQFNPRGAAVKPRYVLKVTVTVARIDLGIQRNATSLRSQITMAADYALSATGSEHPVYQSKSSTITAFNIPDDAYAATVAEEHARDQAAQDLSQDIATRITLFLRQRPG